MIVNYKMNTIYHYLYTTKARKKREEKEEPEVPKSPKARNIHRLASLGRTKEEIVEEIADDCKKRNSDNIRQLVVITDGALISWDSVAKMPKAADYAGIPDIIHVAKYLRKAGNTSYGENNPKSEKWVYDQPSSVLQGRVGRVVGGPGQTSEKRKPGKRERKVPEGVIRYFGNHRKRMCHDEYSEAGFPIGSGVAESACGHTVRDRTEGSGRRWSIKVAESALLPGSVHTSGDWDAYRDSHMEPERKRLYGGISEALGIADDYADEIRLEKAA